MEAIDKLVEIMRGDNAQLSKAAAEALLDRGFGKPTQQVIGAGDEGEHLIAVERKIVRPAD
jgi:hypothetical protein